MWSWHTHTHGALEEVETGLDGDFGVSKFKLQHWRWIGHEVLVSSTGNSVQSLGIHQDGREYEKKNVYICMTESLCCTAEMDTTV